MQYYQQGDVLMKPVENIPDNASKEPEPILAEGEGTGHYHKAIGAGVTLFRFRGSRYLSAPHGAEVVHPEHKPICITPGDYQIDQVLEYDHFGELAERDRWRTVPASQPGRVLGLRQPQVSTSGHVRRVRD